jgi:hypothetical protein
MNWETVYEDIKTKSWITLFILSSFSYFFLSYTQTLGTILGGLLIILNFRVFQRGIRKAFSPDKVLRTGKTSIILKYYFRLFVLAVILFILLWNGWVDPIGLAIGLSTVVISIVTLGISMAFKRSTREAS